MRSDSLEQRLAAAGRACVVAAAAGDDAAAHLATARARLLARGEWEGPLAHEFAGAAADTEAAGRAAVDALRRLARQLAAAADATAAPVRRPR